MVSKLEELISISREMLKGANAGQWQSVVELESERHIKLELYFEQLDLSKFSERDIAQLHDTINHLISCDGQIATIISHAKDEAAKALGELKSARRAVSTYLDNSTT